MKRYSLMILTVVLALLLVAAVGVAAQSSSSPDAQIPQGPLPPGQQEQQVSPDSQALRVVQEPLAPTGSSFTYQGRLTAADSRSPRPARLVFHYGMQKPAATFSTATLSTPS